MYILTQNMYAPLVGPRDTAVRLPDFVEHYAGTYDVLLLQEVFIVTFLGMRVAGVWPWIETELRRRHPHFQHFARMPVSPSFGQDSGLMIASRWPLSDVRGDYFPCFSGLVQGEAWTSKGVLSAVVDTGQGTNVTLITTHLNSASEECRWQQLRVLGSHVVDRHTSAAVLGGDLNINFGTDEHAWMRVVLGGWDVLGADNGGPDGARIDYLLTWNMSSANATVLDPTPPISDHIGVSAKVFLTNHPQ